MRENAPKQGLSLVSLSLVDAAKILAKSGSLRATEAALHKDVAAGAPLNADGTMNLIHYGAWLVREQASGH